MLRVKNLGASPTILERCMLSTVHLQHSPLHLRNMSVLDATAPQTAASRLRSNEILLFISSDASELNPAVNGLDTVILFETRCCRVCICFRIYHTSPQLIGALVCTGTNQSFVDLSFLLSSPRKYIQPAPKLLFKAAPTGQFKAMEQASWH